mgnify:FL=1
MFMKKSNMFMKKSPIFLLPLFLLTSCGNGTLKKQALDYFPKAVDYLIDETDNYVDISKADYISYVTLDTDDDTTKGCFYFVTFKLESSTIERYAGIAVEEATYETGFYVAGVTYQTRKLMVDDYDDILEEIQEIKGGEYSDYFVEFNYIEGSLTSSQIKKVVKDLTK